MTIYRPAVLLAVATAGLLVNACGSSAPTATHTSTPSSTVTEEVPPENIPSPDPGMWAPSKYASPVEMWDKATAAGFECHDNTPGAQRLPRYNVYGALAVSCFHGSAGETVYFSVYPTSTSEHENEDHPGMPANYFGPGWGVQAENPATVQQLKVILS